MTDLLDSQYRDPATIVDLPLVTDTDPHANLLIPDGSLTVRRSVLPGGIRLLTQHVPSAESTAIGFWFGVGSRDESAHDAGVSHFLEHLLFKGTNRLTALDIAQRFDGAGAEWNAATTMESTYYWSHMVDSDLPSLLPTLVEMVTDAALRADDVDTERYVILDELAMTEDSSTDVLFEHFSESLYPDSSLGRPIGGHPETVRDMPRDLIERVYRERYQANTLVVAAAGSVRHDDLAEMLLRALRNSPWTIGGEGMPAPRRVGTESHPQNQIVNPGGNDQPQPDGQPSRIVVRKEVEQAHVVVGGPHLAALDPLGPVSSVLLDVLGGGMSSRLFQEIRERRGLAYSTFAFGTAYTGIGNFGLYASCSPSKLTEVENLLWGELEKLAATGPTQAEMTRTKGQERGGLQLGLAETTARMSRLANADLRGRLIPTPDALARIDAVQAEDVQALAARMLEVPRHTVVVTSRS